MVNTNALHFESLDPLIVVPLGISCLLTFILFCYVLYKIGISSAKAPKWECLIMILSTLQSFLGVYYYFVFPHPNIMIVNKFIKVIQCEIISRSCIAILFQRVKRMRADAILAMFTFCISGLLLYTFIESPADVLLFNKRMEIVFSSFWFILAVVVAHTSFKVKENITISSLLKFDDNRAQLDNTLTAHDQDVKCNHFILLTLVEAVTAAGTLLWDVVIFYSIHMDKSDKALIIDMPFLKEALYTLSSTILIIIPNWTVFYVFYWQQRWYYAKISSKWDLKLNLVMGKPVLPESHL